MELSKLQKDKNFLRYYLLGFSDGESCFSVAVKKEDTAKFGFTLDPIFQVTQHKKNEIVLELFEKELGCGRIIKKSGQEDLLVFLVDNRKQLAEKILPFFEKFEPIAKNDDFRKFSEIVKALENKEHSDLEKFKQLVRKAYEMNLEGKQRKHKLEEILDQVGSSETIRRTINKVN